MAIELICRKLGTTRLYDDEGQSVPVTVLEAGPDTVVQKKTEDKDGYTALQLGFGPQKPGRLSRALRGHFEKAGVEPQRVLFESRLSAEDAESYQAGQKLGADLFSTGQVVDVIGTSKGRGTAGVVKRHNFTISRRTHGTHEAFRHGGSIGAGSFPGKVIKGLRMPGRLGAERVTTRNLRVVRVDAARNLLYLRGAVPGHKGGLVRVRPAVS